MVSFFIALVALLIGYLVYGKFVEKQFAPDNRPTPAFSQTDGVDYIPLPGWKVFMIQFLNIAGTGPIFGAIMGAQFGPSSYLWIVFGCIFAGAVHDYLCGMLSVRHYGEGVPELVGLYLGDTAKKIMLVFSVFLLLMVGTVFVYSPAIILGDKMGGDNNMVMIWCLLIFFYYIIATMLPIDKIIGRIYPLFAFSLMFMAVALCIVLIKDMPDIPEVWDGLDNMKPSAGPIFPCLFITIACGALSGFHATQSPLMARCMKYEKEGRPIFYGAMIAEGVVALIWAAVSSYFFYGGAGEALGASLKSSAPQVVTLVSEGWLGTLGGVLALMGVVAAPITSGDTAFRSARLIISEFVHLNQKKIVNRFIICIPLFLIALGLLWFNIADENGFNVIWNYFGWANQSLATIVLWTETVYLVKQRKIFYITLIPAMFMTAVTVSFLILSPIAFGLDKTIAYIFGLAAVLIATGWFCHWYRKNS
ncbi:MAG: carbon starvation protein A [Bacteroidaceae bacterium]|nr:carbon starvation protein A [Bacteroidaceae bacterium]